MTYISVDVESDGPCPGLYSMVSLGAVAIVGEEQEWPTFYVQLHPISAHHDPKALEVSGHSRVETLTFPPAETGMDEFDVWVRQFKRPLFISDNNGFDWQFVNYYFHRFCGDNPFGFSSFNIGSYYKGLKGDVFSSFKHLRRTKHTHHPVDDARGNAEAFVTMLGKEPC